MAGKLYLIFIMVIGFENGNTDIATVRKCVVAKPNVI